MEAHRFRIARHHLAILAALILASASCLVAAAAQATLTAAKPKSTLVAEDALGKTTGKCPKGTSVVSGGFSSPDFFKLGSMVYRTSSARKGRGWQVTAAGLGGNNGRVIAHAYCDTEGLALRTRKAKTKVPVGGRRVVTARCRKGETVVSGGFLAPNFNADGGPQPAVVTSMAAGKRGWKVDAAVPDDSGGVYGPGKIVAHAYCSSDAPKVLTKRKRVQADASEESRGTTTRVKCPGGTRAISGGFKGFLQIATDTGNGSVAVTSRRLGKARGWLNEFFAIGETVDRVPATTYAYCVRR